MRMHSTSKVAMDFRGFAVAFEAAHQASFASYFRTPLT